MLDSLLHLPNIYFQTCEYVLKRTPHKVFMLICQRYTNKIKIQNQKQGKNEIKHFHLPIMLNNVYIYLLVNINKEMEIIFLLHGKLH